MAETRSGAPGGNGSGVPSGGTQNGILAQLVEMVGRNNGILMDMQKQLANHEVRFDRMDERLDGIDARLDGMDERLDGIDARLDGIDVRLDGIDARLDGMDGRLDGMDGRLDAVESQLAEFRQETNRRFDDLTKEVRVHGRLLGKHTIEIESIKETIGID